MALYIVALVLAIYAAIGVERLERKEGSRHVIAWLIAAGVTALLAVSGAFGAMAEAWSTNPQAAAAARGAILRGALGSAVALAAVGTVALVFLRGRIPAPTFAIVLALLVSGDLWRNARPFWNFSDSYRKLYGEDDVTRLIKKTPPPYRVLDAGVYPGSVLMAFDIPQVLGHHSFELRWYDALLNREAHGATCSARSTLWNCLA